MTIYCQFDSPIGPITLTASPQGLTGLWLDVPKHARDFTHYRRDDVTLAPARQQLEEYFAGARQQFSLPLAASGTAFQQQVWAALCAIPYGQTTSYGALAKDIGNANAVRAVGTANGSNPLGIIVPCHRVIGADGSMTGYAGGLERKRWLLAHEAKHVRRDLFDL